MISKTFMGEGGVVITFPLDMPVAITLVAVPSHWNSAENGFFVFLAVFRGSVTAGVAFVRGLTIDWRTQWRGDRVGSPWGFFSRLICFAFSIFPTVSCGKNVLETPLPFSGAGTTHVRGTCHRHRERRFSHARSTHVGRRVFVHDRPAERTDAFQKLPHTWRVQGVLVGFKTASR